MLTANRLLLVAVSIWAAMAACATASTVPFFVPYTEDFASTAQNWRTSSSATTATYNPAGGPDGGSYISSAFTTPAAGPGPSAQVVFRARDQYESSGNIFFGDWIGAGVPSVDFWFRQDSGQDINVGLRFAVFDNAGQAMLARFPEKVSSGIWTHLTMAIDPTNPQLTDETGPTHDNFVPVFEHVNYITFFADLSSPLIGSSQVLNFGLDRFTVVPESSGWQLACVGLPLLAWGAWTRRRQSAA